jgi:hypothetical protein
MRINALQTHRVGLTNGATVSMGKKNGENRSFPRLLNSFALRLDADYSE